LVVTNENVPNTNDNSSEEISKKIISHYETVIVKLREELSQQRQLLQKFLWLKAVPRPEGLVLNTLSDTSILQLLYSSVLSIYNCKASISSLRSVIKRHK
jgi:hypothetical protein